MGLSCTLHAVSADGAARLAAGETANPAIIASFELEKTWGAVHFLVGGAPEIDEESSRVEDFLLSGSFQETSEHVAVHTANEVQEFAAFLKATSVQALSARFDPEAMNREEVYGEPWDASGQRYATQYLNDFVTFISTAAQQGHGIMVVIC